MKSKFEEEEEEAMLESGLKLGVGGRGQRLEAEAESGLRL